MDPLPEPDMQKLCRYGLQKDKSKVQAIGGVNLTDLCA